MNLKDLTAKIYWNNAQLYAGTVWLCSDDYVLTAAHCVVTLQQPEVYRGPFRLLFPSGEIVTDEVVWLDPELDVALLAVDQKLTSHLTDQIKQLRTNLTPGSLATEDKSWNAYGFPFASPSGLVLDGTISDLNAKITQRSTPAIQLLCNQGGFLARYDSEGRPAEIDKSDIMALTGASGAAVVHHGEIIGLVRSGPPKLGQKVVFATPLGAIAEKFPQVAEVFQQNRQNHIDLIRSRWLSWEAQEVRPALVNDVLEGRPNIVHVRSGIYNLWDQFIRERTWHEDIANQLKQIRDSATEVRDLAWLVERIDRLDFGRSYRQIVIDFKNSFKNANTQVAELIRELEEAYRQSLKGKDPVETQTRYETELAHARAANSGLYTLSREFEPPLFRRCFLITGSSGAGKTHFITQLLSSGDQNSADREYLVLPLMTPTKEGKIEDLLLSRIHEASGENDWTSLEEFCALLAQRLTGDAPGSNERPLKLVLAVDDLDKWVFLRGDDFLRELSEFIAAKTSVHNLFWVLNYHNANYDKLSADRFWTEYSAVRAIPRTGIRETEYRSTNLGGWYLLDGFNEAAEVGLEIIRVAQGSEDEDGAEPSEVDAFQTRLKMMLLFPNESTIRNLSNPFIAWIVADLSEEDNIDWNTLDLSFVEFVSAFWQKRKLNLVPVLANPSINKAELSAEELDRSVWIVAKALSQFPDLYPGRSALIKEGVTLAEKFSLEHRDQKSIESIVAILNQGNLLRAVTKTAEPGFGLPPEQQIEILIETFWEYYIAAGLIDLDSVSKEQAESIWRKLQTIATRKDIREGISTFFFLLSAKASTEPVVAGLIAELLRLGIKSQDPLSSSIWFAGQKGNTEFQHKLAELAHERPLEFSEPHTLYAFMAFVGDCSSQVLSPIDRLRLLQPHYRTIQEFALSDFYYFVARRIARQLSLKHEASELMVILTGCEEMHCAPQLAKLTIRVIRDAVLNKREDMVKPVIGYLQDLSQANDLPTSIPSGKSRPYRYRELLMHEICERLIQAYDAGAKTYNLLVDNGWYDPAKTGISEPIASEMQQQANIAFGHWFRSQWDVDREYVKLVRRLSLGDRHDRETAFYLIRHTIPMKGPQNLPVAYDLRRVLRKLYKDPDLAGLVSSYQQFFAVNIKPVRRSAGTRRAVRP